MRQKCLDHAECLGLWLVLPLFEACINTSTLGAFDLQTSARLLTDENVILGQHHAPREMLLITRTQAGQPVQNKNITPKAFGCIFTRHTQFETVLHEQHYGFDCEGLGLQPITTQMNIDNQTIKFPKVAGYINTVPENPQDEIPVGWSLIVQAAPTTATAQADENYLGTVRLTSTDPLAVLPEPYTFQRQDFGIHYFIENIQIKSEGLQEISIVDTETQRPVQPNKQFLFHPLEPKSIMAVNVQNQYPATAPVTLYMTLTDAYGASVPFTGEFVISTSQLAEPLRQSVQLAKGEIYALPPLHFPTPGIWEVQVEAFNQLDPNTTLEMRRIPISIVPGPATIVHISTESNLAIAGRSVLARCRIEDDLGNLVSDYVGELQLQNSDPQSVLPIIELQAEAGGMQYISLSFYTAGLQSVTLAPASSSLRLKEPISWTVQPAAARQMSLQIPTDAVAGVPFLVTASLTDIYGNRASQTGTQITLQASSPTAPQLDFPLVFDDQGLSQLNWTITQAATYTVLGRPQIAGTIHSETQTLDVRANVCAQVDWAGNARQLTWLEESDFSAKLLDAYGNPCSTPNLYRITSNDPNDTPHLPQNLIYSAVNPMGFSTVFHTIGERHLAVQSVLDANTLQPTFAVEALRVESLIRGHGYAHQNCALLSNRQSKCWGNNLSGRLGIGDSLSRGKEPNSMGVALPAVQVPHDRYITQITSGDNQTCLLLDNGSISCLGVNVHDYGPPQGIYKHQVGNQLWILSVLNDSKVVYLANGYQQTCAIVADGRVSCWGAHPNHLGIPGGPTRGWWEIIRSNENLVVDLGPGERAVQLALGGSVPRGTYRCAVLENQRLKCWGDGWGGVIGSGGWNDFVGPEHMGANLPYVNLGTNRFAQYVTTSEYATNVLLTNGRVKRFGKGDWEPNGYNDKVAFRGTDPATMGDNLPEMVFRNNAKVQGMDSGRTHTCVLFGGNGDPTLDGQVQCFGFNYAGNLGMGDTMDRGNAPWNSMAITPTVPLGTGRTARQISAFRDGTCVLLDTYQVKCWGANVFGELGIDSDITAMGDQPGEMGDALPVVRLW